eukprot:12883538-Alexandrium_andersonii.AAC.1
MSASLVGSEMCIRDRRSSRPTDIAHSNSTSTVRARDQKPCMAQAKHDGTVSYTHLTLPTICSV